MSPAGAGHTVVKVCGITRMEDARDAVDAGADWLGFVITGESPRRIEPEWAADMAIAHPNAVAVAVLVAPRPDEALLLARRACAARVQLHRVDAAAWPADFPLPIAFAVPVARDGALTEPLPPPAHLVLLDTARAGQAGGTGETFPWETARVVAGARPVLLAGGLHAANVTVALEQVRPFGVDASSRLESAPGIKDRDQVRRYVAAVRAFDAAQRGSA